MVCEDGKTHESLLTTALEPYQIHTAMLLLGARGAPPKDTSTPPSAPGDAPDTVPILGDALDISVSWEWEQTKTVKPAEQLVLNEKSGKALKRGPWTYNGSWIFDGRFVVQTEP